MIHTSQVRRQVWTVSRAGGLSKTPQALLCLILPPRCPTWAGRAWGLRPALLHPDRWGVGLLGPSSRPARVSGRDEACPCPLPGRLGSAGAAGYWKHQGPAHLIKSKGRVSSFYRPHKASLVAISAHSSPWHPVPSPGQGEGVFFPWRKRLIFQTHEITRNAMGGSVPQNVINRVTPQAWCRVHSRPQSVSRMGSISTLPAPPAPMRTSPVGHHYPGRASPLPSPASFSTAPLPL